MAIVATAVCSLIIGIVIGSRLEISTRKLRQSVEPKPFVFREAHGKDLEERRTPKINDNRKAAMIERRDSER